MEPIYKHNEKPEERLFFYCAKFRVVGQSIQNYKG